MTHPQEAGKSKGQKADDEMKNILSAYNEQAKGSSLVDFANGWNAAKRYAQSREQPWVRVEPGCEMPENHQEVLIFTDPVISNAVYTDRNGHGLEFLNLAFHFGDTQPTHWKPLPPAPPKD